MGPLAAFAPELITAAGEVGAGVGAGLTAPTPYQEKHPFTSGGSGTADQAFSDLRSMLHLLAPGLVDKLASPVTLPDAVVHNIPSVGGFSLGDVGDLAKPPSLPGLKIGTTPFSNELTYGNGSNVPGHRQVGDGLTDANPPGNSPGEQSPRPSMKVAGPVRQRFAAPSFPSAQPDDGVPQDPTSAALLLLKHAATAA